MVGEQSVCQSNWNFAMEILKNSPWKVSLCQRRSIYCHLGKLDHFDKEYCFKLVKSMPERIKAVVKARGKPT